MICALPRSGSNLLCELLAATHRLGNPDEWLNQDRRQWNCSEFGLPETATLEEMIARLQERTQTLNGVFAHKILRYSYDHLLKELRAIPENAGLGERQLMEKYFPGLRLLYIYRSDRLRQAVSLLKASQSALWHHNNRKVRKVLPIHFSWTEIDSILRDLAGQEAAWEAFLEATGLPVMRINYEDLTSATNRTMEEVAAFLGMDAGELDWSDRVPAHKPTRGRINKEWEERYQQLEEQVFGAAPGQNMQESLRQAEIHVDKESLEVVAGEMICQRVTVRNTSDFAWLPYGRRDGTGWIKVACQIISGEGETLSPSSSWRELPGVVAPGERVELEIFQKSPGRPGDYTIWVDCVVTPSHWFHGVSKSGIAVPLRVVASDEVRFLEDYFGELEQQDSLVLFKSGWFGSFHILNFPRIYHFGLGPLECKGTGIRENHFILESEHHGTLRISAKEFPVMWSESVNGWLKWHRGTHMPAKLSILKEDKWVPYNFSATRESLDRAGDYFGVTFPDDGRLDIEWLGMVDASDFPRILHEKLGLVWCSGPGASEDSYFFCNTENGWMWTSPEAYPHIRLMKQEKWLLVEELLRTQF